MSELNRPRWTKSNARELYIAYFDILNSSSGVEYLEMIYSESSYKENYYNYFFSNIEVALTLRELNIHACCDKDVYSNKPI